MRDYATKDGIWAAIPYGNQYVIVHLGQQVHITNNYKNAKAYILNQINSSSTLKNFLK